MRCRTAEQMAKKQKSAIEAFLALPDAENERIWQEIDRMTPEELLAQSRPLTRQERAQCERARNKMKRPKRDRKQKRA